ncbi:hypothetical protein [Corallococcus exiguus]|uniref:hypothetical protein n=1 Tax=Corallococcus exiguus TaxID=83462 RepID=UPI001493EE9B|nr:hypothetical protein [Corallococcus exiguus]NPC70083.1 hypothetical protein [Corallococcus exiguus]NPD22694.1 hypothetical protein [Corallococcus exiguus]
MKKRRTRFTVVAPSGNPLMFIRRDEPAGYEDDEDIPHHRPRQGLKTARRLRGFKGDDAAAAKVRGAALRLALTPADDTARQLSSSRKAEHFG